MLVAFGDSGGGEQGFSAKLGAALAAGHAILGAGGLPSTSTTHRANFSGCLHSDKYFYFQCALRGAFAQVIAGDALCTSCEGEDLLVDKQGETLFTIETQSHREGKVENSKTPRIFTDKPVGH